MLDFCITLSYSAMMSAAPVNLRCHSESSLAISCSVTFSLDALPQATANEAASIRAR